MQRTGLTFAFALLLAVPTLAEPLPARDLSAGLTTGEALARGTSGFFDFFQPCDSSVFRLDEAAAKDIGQGGNAALDALGTRSAAGNGGHYVDWLATPVDIESRESWSVNGYVWGGLACGLNSDWTAKSQHIATSPGSFYAFGDGVLLLVDPVERLVITTHRPMLH